MAPPSVLVLAIDAANPHLIDQWSSEGLLPNIRLLSQRGMQGRVRSIDGFFVGSTWPSFQTGLGPARHGLHYLAQLEPGTYGYRVMADTEFIRGQPFWERLSLAGQRVAVLDVPLTRLESLRGGMQVVEWGSHDAVFGFRASPAATEADIQSRFGLHPLTSGCDAIERTPDGYASFIAALERGVRAKTALTSHFLDAGGWDFFMQVFTEAHCVGHQCWHLHDAAHPSHDPAILASIGDPLLRVYTAIDDAIGRILDSAGDSFVLLLVAHGMAHSFGAHFLLHDMLVRLGVSTPPAVPQPGRFSGAAHRGARDVWRRLPVRVREALSPLRAAALREPAATSGLPRIHADTASSRCFPVHNGLAASGIRLNLAGREPRGVLPPSQADAFCRELGEALLAFVDDETGEPVVRRVIRTAETFDGDQLDDLPDLLVEWSDTRRLGNTRFAAGAGATLRIRSPATGAIEGSNDYGRTGEHRIEGMFIAAGAGIRPGRMEDAVSILDFAPTLCALGGVDIPATDGQVIRALVDR